MIKFKYIFKNIVFCLIILFTSSDLFADNNYKIVLVDHGKPNAIIVIEENPTPITILAVDELLYHVKLSTGVTLKVVFESDLYEKNENIKIYIGKTKSTQNLKFNIDKLSPDDYRLLINNNVYIFGKDNGEAYDSDSGYNGTLYGVYDFIERITDVKWLWPGELGVSISRKDVLTASKCDEISGAKLEWRQFRIRHIEKQLISNDKYIELLGFSKECLSDYNKDLRIFLRRHRVGSSHPKIWVAHNDIYKKKFNTNPEWFSMNESGERVGPTLNVSNTELQKYFAEENPNKYKDQPHIMIGEADDSLYCHSKESMAWDEPLPEGWNNRKYRSVSNRYAKFAVAVRDHAYLLRTNKDFYVTMFIYMGYFHAPTIDIDLKGVHGAFCPWYHGVNPWYPMTKQNHEFIKKTWVDWKNKGIDLAYRPNYLLGGYVMPHLSTWQAGDMFKFASENGMRGFDFDSLWAQWAAKGPMLYMHMRLGLNPTLDIEKIRDEYFKAFGPAATYLKKYFDYWEDYSSISASKGVVTYNTPERVPVLYSDKVFIPAIQILSDASRVLHDEPNHIYRDRLNFVKKGLDHAILASKFIKTLKSYKYEPEKPSTEYRKSKEALIELINFRKKNEYLFYSDLTAAASTELKGLTINSLLNDLLMQNVNTKNMTH